MALSKAANTTGIISNNIAKIETANKRIKAVT